MTDVPARFDLHTHSHFSDGHCAPAALIERARENGVTHLGLTDHDCIDGLAGLDGGAVTVIPGVEISCNWLGREIHVVGLQIDIDNAALQALLASQQRKRRERAAAIAGKLQDTGIDGLTAYIEALPCTAVTRSHVANFLLAAGAVKNHQQAFKKYLGKGARAYIPADWCPLGETVQAIQSAGGIAVLAHPGRYRLNRKQLLALLGAFARAGGDALEVSYPNIDENQQRLLLEQSLKLGLMHSAGSDFHDPAARWTDIGKFPPLRDTDQSVFNHSRWRG